MLSPLVWSNTADLLYSEAVCRNDGYRILKESRKREDKPKFVEALLKLCCNTTCNVLYNVNPAKIQSTPASVFIRSRMMWSEFPEAVALGPEGGQLPPDRIERKILQLNNIMSFAVPFLQQGTKVVDFCCGCGHQSIPLAYLFPHCHFTLVDMNPTSLEICRERCRR